MSANQIIHDFHHRSWERDIDTFARAKDMWSKFTSPQGKSAMVAQMERIQARWPQHIRSLEIPK